MNESKFILTNLRARINKVVSLMHSLTRGRAAQAYACKRSLCSTISGERMSFMEHGLWSTARVQCFNF